MVVSIEAMSGDPNCVFRLHPEPDGIYLFGTPVDRRIRNVATEFNNDPCFK